MRLAFLKAAVGAMVLAQATAGLADTSTYNQLTGTTNWDVAANWNGNDIAGDVPAEFEDALFTTPTGTRSIDVSGQFSVSGITFDNTSAVTFTNSIRNFNLGGDMITFDAAGTGPAFITSSGIGANQNRMQVDMTFTDTVNANVTNTAGNATAGALSITGNISGPGGLTKTGDGLLTIALNAGSSPGDQVKAYTGPTTLSGGRTRWSVNAPPTQTSSFTIDDAQLTFIGNGSYTLGPGNLILSGNGPASGPFAQFGGLIRPDTNAIVTVTNNVLLQDDAAVAVFGTATSLTLSGVISGPSTSTFRQDVFGGQPSNHGTLIITGANTYEGGTDIIQGTFRLSGASATAGTGNVFVDGVSDRGNGILASGKLDIQSDVLNGIADSAIVTLTGGTFGGQAILGAGVNELIGGLVLGGVTQTVAGTYGSTASGAMFQDDLFFQGTGVFTIPAAPGQDGDHNEDGIVDAADYVAWRKTPGDFGGDPGGYNTWVANFGEGGPGSGGGSGAVPEPSTVVLIGFTILFALAGGRNRSS
jgi:autotransporter-associated beta strand protein